jgi:hypothetical protein
VGLPPIKLGVIFKGFKSTCYVVHHTGGEAMIGAVVFVISFVLFLLISLVTPFPPGTGLVETYIQDVTQTSYAGLVTGIINGVIYGVIIWFVFSIAKMLYDRTKKPKEVVVKVETANPQ